MSFKTVLDSVINTGVKPGYLTWEKYLTRKLNFITLIGIFNVALAVLFYVIFDYKEFLIESIPVILVGPMVLVLNKYKNYVWAAYMFYIIGFVFFVFIDLKMGINSFAIMFYFPVIISLVQLLNRKELLKHFLIISLLCFISIVIILIGFDKHWYHSTIIHEDTSNLAYFNITLSFFTALSFIFAVVTESQKQEKIIQNILAEKEVLLAEVFHRVKNNMNIVTSLLNLKKDTSDSKEVQAALEECRNRVYSMALVHQKVFNTSNVVEVNFHEYINELVKDLLYSIGGENASVDIRVENINLDLTHAIPCGLILNELITNSIKYAQLPNKQLKIWISLLKSNNQIELTVKDNGPGIPEYAITKFNSLGLELIKSLSEQIDGVHSFKNDNGLVFSLKFMC